MSVLFTSDGLIVCQIKNLYTVIGENTVSTQYYSFIRIASLNTRLLVSLGRNNWKAFYLQLCIAVSNNFGCDGILFYLSAIVCLAFGRRRGFHSAAGQFYCFFREDNAPQRYFCAVHLSLFTNSDFKDLQILKEKESFTVSGIKTDRGRALKLTYCICKDRHANGVVYE